MPRSAHTPPAAQGDSAHPPESGGAWTRVHARSLARSHEESVRALLARVAFVELAPSVLERALEPFPTPVRTLDALHLASLEFLRKTGQKVELATFDERQATAAKRMRIPLFAF